MSSPEPGGGIDDALVLGAGLTGLSAARGLSSAGLRTRVVDRGSAVGGLARTIARGPFRFDLGGHRFFTRDAALADEVRRLLGPELLTVARRSQLLLRGRRIDYPLHPRNALAGLGAGTVARILADGLRERARRALAPRPLVSLEDWVVAHFGRALFDLYFREYSEKVWGIGCRQISMDWVAQRIQGLSLGAAVAHALWPRGGRDVRSLTDRFLYPAGGIGRLADRLREEVEQDGTVTCGVEVSRIHHRWGRVEAVEVRDGARATVLEAAAFVSTLALPDVARMLDPAPPAEVLRAAARLRFRDLVVVAVMLDRERATDQSWIYFPERRVPFGRVHEPTNWSAAMAPPGRTLLVAEAFCTVGDATWSASDEELSDRAVRALAALGLLSRREVLGAAVVRVPQAYPLFDVGYATHRQAVLGHLARLENLFPAGRGGTFRYDNMDQALAAGAAAAGRVRRHLERRAPAAPPARARRSA